MPMKSGDRASLIVIGLITFIGDCCRGVLFPILWPFAHTLGAGRVELVWLVAAFSIGRISTQFLFGRFSDFYGHRIVLLFACTIAIIATIIWANARTLAALFVGQILLGVGTGTLGVTRSYVIETTKATERTNMLAWLGSLQYAGFAATPLLGSVISIAGDSISSYWKFALPASLIGLSMLACWVCLLFVFKDSTTPEIEIFPIPPTIDSSLVMENMTPRASALSANRRFLTDDSRTAVTAAAPSMFLLVVMAFMNLTTRGTISVYETQGSAILLDHYYCSELFLGFLVTSAGVIGTLQLYFFKRIWTSRFSDVDLAVGGLFTMAVTQILLIEIPPHGDSPHLWHFATSMFLLYAFCYPIGNSAVLSVFSKLMLKSRQGEAQGVLATMGSLARVAFPLISGYLVKYMGESACFTIIMIVMAVSTVTVCSNYKALLSRSVYVTSTLDRNKINDDDNTSFGQYNAVSISDDGVDVLPLQLPLSSVSNLKPPFVKFCLVISTCLSILGIALLTVGCIDTSGGCFGAIKVPMLKFSESL